MGIVEMKRDIREKIIDCPYNYSKEDVWELLESYDRCLAVQATADELAEAAFLRGDVSFHKGRYWDTISSLTRCLGIEKSMDYRYLETEAYNMLGMLFSFTGYENVALNYYLLANENAKKNRSVRGQVSALLNAAILYQYLEDYPKAMSYCKQGYEVAKNSHSRPEMLLILLCLVQQAQLLFQMGNYEDAKRVKREADSYYQVTFHDGILLPKSILEVWMETQDGTERRVEELVEEIYGFLMYEDTYIEQTDSCVEFCAFLIEKDRKADARRFLDILKEKLGITELLETRMRLEELEVLYRKKFEGRAKYVDGCHNYAALRREYEGAMQKFKQQNLANIENWWELEKQRLEFEYRSKCDLATGLLNRDAFRFEVENYLAERNRGITDAMILVDIDNFKLVNDSYGHLVGDELIKRLASLLKEQFSEEFTGRYEGDEFAVFLRGIDDIAHLEERVEGLREKFEESRFGRNRNVQGSVSIGVSYNSDMDTSYRALFSCANEALSKAKEYGKNRVAFYEIKRGILKYV